MIWVYNGKLQSTLTIPFYKVNEERIFEVRLTTEETEKLDRAYLCLYGKEYLGNVWGRIKGTTKWYKIGSIWDSECFLGTILEWTLLDIEIKIGLPSDFDSGVYRIPFVVMHGDHDHSPNRAFCAEHSLIWERAIPKYDLVFSSAENLNKPILDLQTTTDEIGVSGIISGSVVESIEITLNVTHPEDGDLGIYLTGPDSTVVYLSGGNGYGGANFTDTIFSDDALVSIADGVPPFTGSFIPDEPLSSLYALGVNGTWALSIEDAFEENEGTLNSWSIRIKTVGSELLPIDILSWGDDDFEVPLFTGSLGGCPPFETGSNCGVPNYGVAIPSETISQFSVVTTYIDSGVKKMKLADNGTYADAAAVGIMIDADVIIHEAVGTATVQSEDGRYIYEHGGQEVDAEGNLLDVWHPEIRVMDTLTGIWRDIGTCGEEKQRDHTIVLLNGNLYIFGGDDGGITAGYTTYYKSLYEFDLETLQCTQLDDAPVERAGAGAILNDNEIHFIGGWNSGGPLSGVDWYDTVSGDWHIVTLPPELEEFAPTIYPYVGYQSGWSRPIPDPNFVGGIITTTCVEGRIYAWGLEAIVGRGGVLVLKTFPTSLLGWSREEVTVPDGALVGKAIAYQGKVYIANPFALVDYHYVEPHPSHIYDTAAETWTVTVSLPPSLTVGTMYSFDGAALVGSKIYYWGGEDTGNMLDKLRQTIILVFDIPTLTWDATVHYVGEAIYGWKGDVINGVLYQLSSGGYQQSINLTSFTATEITADRDASFGPIWGTAQDGNIYWLELWTPSV